MVIVESRESFITYLLRMDNSDHGRGNIMNMTFLLTISAILVEIALVWTLVIFKQEENKMKKYEEEGDSLEDQMKRSQEYETKSLRSDIPLQLIIYAIFTVVSLIIILIFI